MTSRPENNNNNEMSPGMQQLLTTQAQLVQLMTQIVANNPTVLPPFLPQLLKSQSDLVELMTQQYPNSSNNPLQMGKEISKSKESFETSLRACNICGDIGHTSKDHKDQCPNCDESHPVGECLTSLITCFLCDGNNHVPVQCHLYPVIQQVKQRVGDGFCQPLEKTHGNIGLQDHRVLLQM